MALVLDTHAVIWYLSGSNELSLTARLVIQTAERNGDDVSISAISLVEIVYLAERGRLPSAELDRLGDALKDYNAKPRSCALGHCGRRSCQNNPARSRSGHARPYHRCNGCPFER